MVGKEGHPWLALRNKNKDDTTLPISIKELLKISGEWMETKKSAVLYLDDFKSSQVEKLLDFIECVEHPPSVLTKPKIKIVAEELGVDQEYLQRKLKELDYCK